RGLGIGHRAHLRGLLDASFVRSTALVRLDLNRQLALRQMLLTVGARDGLAELTLLAGRSLLAGIRLDLLLRDLPRAKLLEDRRDVLVTVRSRRGADEHLFELEVVVTETRLHLLAGD